MTIATNHAKIVEKSILSQRKNTHKGAEVGMSLICPETRKETSVAERQSEQEARGQGNEIAGGQQAGLTDP